MARVSKRSFIFFRLSPVRVNSFIAFAIEQGKTGKSFGVLSAKFETFERSLLTSKAKFPIHNLSQLVAGNFLNGIFKKRDFYGEGTLLVNVWDLYRDEVVLEETLERIKTTLEENDRFEAKEGDVFFCRSSLKPEGVGWSCLLEKLSEPAVFECHLIRARVNSKKILPSFLNYFARSYFGVSYIKAKSVVTTMATIDQGTLYNLPVICPPVEKQIEIVAAMDEARSQRKQKLADADALVSSLDQFILDTLNFRLPPPDNRKVYATTLSRMIGKRIDPYSNKPYFQKLFNAIQNSQHNILTLSNLSIRIFSGTTPLAKGDAYVDPPNGVRFIRSGEITTEGTVTPTSEVHISDEIHTGKMKSSQLQKGDLLIAIVGATIGAVGIYNLHEPANINQAIASVRLNNKEVLGEYICWYLRSSIGQRLLDYFKRPVARANINLAEVGEIPIIIPDLQIQETIITEVYNRRSEAQRLRSEAETGWQAAKQWFEDQLLGGS